MFCKMSPGSYLADLETGPSPSIQVMALFVIANTNIRHRLFMTKPVRYVAAKDDAAFDTIEGQTREYTEAIYKAADLILAEQSASDPKIMVYVKSFLGPIENFISPQIHSRLKGWLPK